MEHLVRWLLWMALCVVAVDRWGGWALVALLAANALGRWGEHLLRRDI